MRAPRSSAPLLAALAVGLVAAAARAEPDAVHLAWVRGPGAEACAGQRVLADRVKARLGRDPFAAGAARTLDAWVTRSDVGWRAQIVVRGADGAPSGTRELTSEAPDCAAVEEAVVLALALAIDPEAGLRPPPAVPVPPPPPVLPPALPVARPPAPEAPSAHLGPFGVTARGGVGWGLLPGAAPAVSLAAHFGLARRVQLTAEALLLPETRTADERFAFGLSAFSIGGCFDVVHGGAVELATCGALWAGSLHAVVFDLTPTEPGDRAWAAGSLSPRLRVAVGPHVHLELGASLFVPFVRRPYTVTGWKEPAFQEAPVAALPFAGVGANFP